jgi:hypothetical protein
VTTATRLVALTGATLDDARQGPDRREERACS